ncbi:hypothetical protein FKM82_012284 [Ascaphus truei]
MLKTEGVNEFACKTGELSNTWKWRLFNELLIKHIMLECIKYAVHLVALSTCSFMHNNCLTWPLTAFPGQLLESQPRALLLATL